LLANDPPAFGRTEQSVEPRQLRVPSLFRGIISGWLAMGDER
jgi:hypothetical protein